MPGYFAPDSGCASRSAWLHVYLRHLSVELSDSIAQNTIAFVLPHHAEVHHFRPAPKKHAARRAAVPGILEGLGTVIYNPDEILLSGIQIRVLTHLKYIYLRVPSCIALVQNFYIESPDIAKMTDAEVAAAHAAMGGAKVRGLSLIHI